MKQAGEPASSALLQPQCTGTLPCQPCQEVHEAARPSSQSQREGPARSRRRTAGRTGPHRAQVALGSCDVQARAAVVVGRAWRRPSMQQALEHDHVALKHGGAQPACQLQAADGQPARIPRIKVRTVRLPSNPAVHSLSASSKPPMASLRASRGSASCRSRLAGCMCPAPARAHAAAAAPNLLCGLTACAHQPAPVGSQRSSCIILAVHRQWRPAVWSEAAPNASLWASTGRACPAAATSIRQLLLDHAHGLVHPPGSTKHVAGPTLLRKGQCWARTGCASPAAAR